MYNEGPKPGDIIAGKYRVKSILGRGRGTLVLAEHTAFEQRVAIRVVSPQMSDPVEVSKFRREARVLAKLGSEHVARVIDVGVQPDGSFYLVRQYLEGTDLPSYLRERRVLPIEEAVGIILQATEAVSETHAYGILVRELAPDHLFLAERSPGVRGGPRVLKVTDFGTAKIMREAAPGSDQEFTATTVLGLSPYSSPEMLRRQPDLDVRTDVWSLAAILYELLGGQAPFGKDMLTLAIAITRDEPLALSRLRGDVPAEIEAAIKRALSKDKNARQADTHAFAASLVRFAPADARGLMERIRDLAQSARQRVGGGPADEEEIEEIEEIDDSPTGDNEDVATRVGRVPQVVPLPARESQPTQPRQARRSVSQEKTEALGFNFIPSDPIHGDKVPGRHAFAGAAAGLEPPAPAGPAPTQMLPAISDRGSHPGVAATPPRTAPPPPPAPPAPSGPHAAAYPAATHEGMHAQAAPYPQAVPGQTNPAWMASATAPGMAMHAGASSSNGRKVAMFAVGGALVALLLLVVVVIALPASPPATASSTSPSAKAAEPRAAAETASATVAAPIASSDEPAASASTESSVALAPSASAAPSAKPKATNTVASTPNTTTTTTTTATAPKTATATATTTSEPPKGGDGTLVVVAVGGTCAFSVNGQPKGTTNSLKLSVPPGAYSVTCKPATGASKSKSVTVKSGSSAMAMFKLN